MTDINHAELRKLAEQHAKNDAPHFHNSIVVPAATILALLDKSDADERTILQLTDARAAGRREMRQEVIAVAMSDWWRSDRTALVHMIRSLPDTGGKNG